MKIRFRTRLVFAMLAGSLGVGCASEPKNESPAKAMPVEKPLTAEQSVLTSVTATVQKVDLASREITLKGPQLDTVTLAVDEQVQRLNELKPGDEVTAQYYVSVAGVLRAP